MRKLMALGPYVMLEIFMPGGTLLALMLYAARRRALTQTAPETPSRLGT